jgi:hypothetical protein
VQDLTERLAKSQGLKNNAKPGSRLAILQAVNTIAGRTESSGTFSISHGDARIYDLIIRDTASPWEMTVVPDKVVPLGNLWSEAIAADEFLLASSFEGVYLHGAEECPPE